VRWAFRSLRAVVPVAVAVLLVVTGGALVGAAQRPFTGERERPRGVAPDLDEARVPYDGRFAFVRLRYGLGAGRGFRREPPWAHDYPRADLHLMKILQEITLLRPHLEESNVFALDDPELHNFPLAYMSEPGFWTPTDHEVEGLRAYLAKGGFLIFDDFRGQHWLNFEAQMRKVMPTQRLVVIDPAHPVFHAFYEIDPAAFVPPYGGEAPVFYGIFEDNDPAKRLQVVANYNNDLGEYWEFSDTGWVPVDLSNEAYKFGVNYIVYGMTH
jgi:Domain of unknown function (DUF4159)